MPEEDLGRICPSRWHSLTAGRPRAGLQGRPATTHAARAELLAGFSSVPQLQCPNADSYQKPEQGKDKVKLEVGHCDNKELQKSPYRRDCKRPSDSPEHCLNEQMTLKLIVLFAKIAADNHQANHDRK